MTQKLSFAELEEISHNLEMLKESTTLSKEDIQSQMKEQELSLQRLLLAKSTEIQILEHKKHSINENEEQKQTLEQQLEQTRLFLKQLQEQIQLFHNFQLQLIMNHYTASNPYYCYYMGGNSQMPSQPQFSSYYQPSYNPSFAQHYSPSPPSHVLSHTYHFDNPAQHSPPPQQRNRRERVNDFIDPNGKTMKFSLDGNIIDNDGEEEIYENEGDNRNFSENNQSNNYNNYNNNHNNINNSINKSNLYTVMTQSAPPSVVTPKDDRRWRIVFKGENLPNRRKNPLATPSSISF